MTTPPNDGLLFDVAAPPTPVERLLLLADQYVQHNDTLDRLLRAGSPSDPAAHVSSAQHLASATHAAIEAVSDARLFASHELADAMFRLQQLAFLSSASTDHELPMARTLTALAPTAAIGCADTVARELHRRRADPTSAPDHRLTTTHHTALREIALGNVVTTSSQGREYAHYRDERVLIGTLRSLEANGLTERVPKSAPSAYIGGPLQDRIRLTSVGVTALAAVISNPPVNKGPGTAPAPAAAATRTGAARSL
ncbi:hypothetical protein [Streptomyces rubiginosohelvolus]|uniref:DUF222 domain-containing protein n=1 Tax=Streptomyces rubiginosohelvolus TaxID=67362 RepID=A0ABW6EST4_9ACTN